MNFLALDTSSNACSVAVQAGDRILNKHVVEARAHTRILMPMIRELLEECQLSVANLDAVILGNGPGSFIGMRIGASVAQGLCFGAGLKIVPISSLAVVAADALANCEADEIAVIQDARMGEVYFARFGCDSNRNPVPIGDETIVAAEELQFPPGTVSIAGDGWARYPKLLELHADHISAKVSAPHPHALPLLRIGAAAYVDGHAVMPHELSPAYLRTKVAEIPQTA